jgi:hypothetical protein
MPTALRLLKRLTTSDENYTMTYKAAYKDCLEAVIDEARGTLL